MEVSKKVGCLHNSVSSVTKNLIYQTGRLVFWLFSKEEKVTKSSMCFDWFG